MDAACCVVWRYGFGADDGWETPLFEVLVNRWFSWMAREGRSHVVDRTHGMATSCQFNRVRLVEASVGKVFEGGFQIGFWCGDTKWATFSRINSPSSDGDLCTTAVSNALEDD